MGSPSKRASQSLSQSIMQKKQLTVEEIMKVNELFHPILLSKLLRDTLNKVTENRKNRDDAQKDRLKLCLDILDLKVQLPAYPAKTKESLLTQMKKQQKKMLKRTRRINNKLTNAHPILLTFA